MGFKMFKTMRPATANQRAIESVPPPTLRPPVVVVVEPFPAWTVTSPVSDRDSRLVWSVQVLSPVLRPPRGPAPERQPGPNSSQGNRRAMTKTDRYFFIICLKLLSKQ